MKTISVWLSIIITISLLSGCSSATTREAKPQVIKYKTLLSNNRINILKVSKGMTKKEVMELMGTTPAKTKNGLVPNPYEISRIVKNGKEYEVMYYLVKKYPPFTSIKRRQATPVVLEGGKVIDWGDGSDSRARTR